MSQSVAFKTVLRACVFNAFDFILVPLQATRLTCWISRAHPPSLVQSLHFYETYPSACILAVIFQTCTSARNCRSPCVLLLLCCGCFCCCFVDVCVAVLLLIHLYDGCFLDLRLLYFCAICFSRRRATRVGARELGDAKAGPSRLHADVNA